MNVLHTNEVVRLSGLLIYKYKIAKYWRLESICWLLLWFAKYIHMWNAKSAVPIDRSTMWPKTESNEKIYYFEIEMKKGWEKNKFLLEHIYMEYTDLLILFYSERRKKHHEDGKWVATYRRRRRCLPLQSDTFSSNGCT